MDGSTETAADDDDDVIDDQDSLAKDMVNIVFIFSNLSRRDLHRVVSGVNLFFQLMRL